MSKARNRSQARVVDPDAEHPTHGLDDVVHQRTRLGVLAILREADSVEFGYLCDTLRLTNGNLSRHLQTLEEAGLVAVRKGYEGKRPRTWLSLTQSGRRALDRELRALRALVARLDDAPEPERHQPDQSRRTASRNRTGSGVVNARLPNGATS